MGQYINLDMYPVTKSFWILAIQLIPWESPNTILTYERTVGSSGERTSQLMFNVSRRFTETFFGGFLVSISLLETDLENVIKSLTFNSFTFK